LIGRMRAHAALPLPRLIQAACQTGVASIAAWDFL
jgi:hypothetical protein